MDPLAWQRYKLEKARESRNRAKHKIAGEVRALHVELSDPMHVPVPRTLLDGLPAMAIVDSALPLVGAQANRVQALENATLCTTCSRSHVTGDGSQGYRDCATRAVKSDWRKGRAPRPTTPGGYYDPRDGTYLRARRNPQAFWGAATNRALRQTIRVDCETGEMLPQGSEALVESTPRGAQFVADWARAASHRNYRTPRCKVCTKIHGDHDPCTPQVKGAASRGKARGGRSPEARARRAR